MPLNSKKRRIKGLFYVYYLGKFVLLFTISCLFGFLLLLPWIFPVLRDDLWGGLLKSNLKERVILLKKSETALMKNIADIFSSFNKI